MGVNPREKGFGLEFEVMKEPIKAKLYAAGEEGRPRRRGNGEC